MNSETDRIEDNEEAMNRGRGGGFSDDIKRESDLEVQKRSSGAIAKQRDEKLIDKKEIDKNENEVKKKEMKDKKDEEDEKKRVAERERLNAERERLNDEREREEREAEAERLIRQEEEDVGRYTLIAENKNSIFSWPQRKLAEDWLRARGHTWVKMPILGKNNVRGGNFRGRGTFMSGGRGYHPNPVFINSIENNNNNSMGESSGYGRGGPMMHNERGRYQRGYIRGNWNRNSAGRGQSRYHDEGESSNSNNSNHRIPPNTANRGGRGRNNENGQWREYRREESSQRGGHTGGNNSVDEQTKLNIMQKELDELKSRLENPYRK